MSIFGTNSSSTSDTPTLEGMLKIMRDFEAKHPKSERIVRIRCGPQILEDLRRVSSTLEECDANTIDSIGGLLIERDDSVPPQLHVVEYADDTEEVCGYGFKSGRRPTRQSQCELPVLGMTSEFTP